MDGLSWSLGVLLAQLCMEFAPFARAVLICAAVAWSAILAVILVSAAAVSHLSAKRRGEAEIPASPDDFMDVIP